LGEQALTEANRKILNLAFTIDRAGGYHVAWIETTDAATSVVITRYSSDGERTWSEPEVLSDAQSWPSLDLAMGADSQGRVHIPWGHEGVFYRRWLPQTGWEPTVELSGRVATAGGHAVGA
jgi:hypothetical protein